LIAPEASADTEGIEAALGREILISERQRANLLVGFFVLLLASFALSLVAIPEGSASVPQGLRPVVIVVGAIGLLYSLLLRRVITRRMQAGGQPPPPFLRSIGVLVETSIPTITMLLVGMLIDPTIALFGPPAWFYFVFITLSTLRLSF
jgi:hypothetical protein